MGASDWLLGDACGCEEPTGSPPMEASMAATRAPAALTATRKAACVEIVGLSGATALAGRHWEEIVGLSGATAFAGRHCLGRKSGTVS